MRVRSLNMNDAHIHCTVEQFAEEFNAVNEMYLKYFKIFGLEKYRMRFSTHDPSRLTGDNAKFVNEPELWKKSSRIFMNSRRKTFARASHLRPTANDTPPCSSLEAFFGETVSLFRIQPQATLST